jgi:hypothetical protein
MLNGRTLDILLDVAAAIRDIKPVLEATDLDPLILGLTEARDILKRSVEIKTALYDAEQLQASNTARLQELTDLGVALEARAQEINQKQVEADSALAAAIALQKSAEEVVEKNDLKASALEGQALDLANKDNVLNAKIQEAEEVREQYAAKLKLLNQLEA